MTDAWTFLQMKREEEEERGRERERERKKKREEKRSARDGGESNANEIKGWRGKRKKERKKEKSQVLENEKTNFSSSSSSSFCFLFFPSCFFLSFLVFWIFFFLQKLAICSTALLSRLSIGFEPPLPPFKVRERETKKKKGATFLFCLLLFFLASTSAMAESSVIEHEAKAEHVIHCFETLLCYFDNVKGPGPVFQDAYCPLFVTWKKKARVGNEEPRLRGCIGTLEPKDLHSSLGEYALISALRDRRFNPIDVKEVQSLLCTVSLLTNFERNLTWLDWEVGKHGMIIEFEDPSSSVSLSATYLPEVAQQQGWTKQECIDSLIQKAGYYGKVTEDIRRKIRLTRYQSSLCTMSYQDYIMMKESN